MLDEIRTNFDQNLARVESLVVTYETHPDAQGQGRKSVEVLDILRAAVVLLHASVEDVLRSVARWKLPGASSDALNDVPLVGQGSNPRKFLLGELAAHRGKTVDQLLAECVNAHLEQSNYNNTGEIAVLLAAISVNVTEVNAQFPELQEMMERRHQIVHRADRQMQVSGSGDHQIRGINKSTVRRWAESARDFCDSLFAAL